MKGLKLFLLLIIGLFSTIQANIIAYFPFNGNAISTDSISLGVVNGATLTKDRFYNDTCAYLFDATLQQSIEFADNKNLDDSIHTSYSISVWIKPSSLNGVQFICSKGLENIELHTNGADVRFIPTAGVYLDAPNALTLNTWTHIVATYSEANSAKIFIDTVEVVASSEALTVFASNDSPLSLGKRSDNTFYFNGVIDDIGIYDNSLTSDEVKKLYIGGKPHTFAGGDGSEDDPLQISTVEQLDAIRNLPTLHFVLINDIDLAGKNWVSIPEFNGTLNGKGHIINNLTSSHGGLIHFLKGSYHSLDNPTGTFAQIDSILLYNVNINSNAIGIGALVDQIIHKNVGYIRNCHVRGTLESGNNTFVGGITGNLGKGSAIRYCSFEGKLIINKAGINNSFGGIAGLNYSGEISNCYTTCDISILDYTPIVNDESATGGIAGTNFGWIDRCYASGTLDSALYTGGIVGIGHHLGDFEHGYVTNSYYCSELSQCNRGIGDDYLSTTMNLSFEEMKQKSNFVDWDFSNVWEQTDGKSLPYLKNSNSVAFPFPSTFHFIKKNSTIYIELCAEMNSSVTYSLLDAPTNTTITDNILSWIPEETGLFDITFVATNAYASKEIVINGFVYDYNGTGSKDDPFQIATIGDLQFLSENSSLWKYAYILTADVNAESTVSLNNTLGFSPIGNDSIPFTGTFYGNGHTISGLTINRPTETNIGLFGVVQNAYIDNLSIINCNVTGLNYVGAFAGWCVSSTISNSMISGNIEGDYDVGGLIGYVYNSKIDFCYTSSFIKGEVNVGGFIGANTSSEIYSSYATGSVEGDSCVGGFGGNISSASVYACYSTADVTGYNYVKGFVGSSDNNNRYIAHSYAAGAVAGELNTDGFGTSRNNYADITNFFDYETTNQPSSISGRSTEEMKLAPGEYYIYGLKTLNWLLYESWTIIVGKTYPAIKGINNAPFAFADSVSGTASALLMNDYDYETLQENLVYRVEKLFSLKDSVEYTSFNDVPTGDSLSVLYRVGEFISEFNDTLWGNRATSTLIYHNNAPLLNSIDTTTIEDESLQLIVSKKDSDGDKLAYSIVSSPKNGATAINGNTLLYVPNENFNGYDTLQMIGTDGILSDTLSVYIVVTAKNDTPTLTSITAQEIEEDGTLTVLLSMTNATDIDGDDLSLIIGEGDNYTVDGTIITPIANFNGELLVPVKVTDRTDTTAAVLATITVDATNDAPTLTSVTAQEITEDGNLEILLSMTNATDIDGDDLSLVIGEGDNYTVDGTIVTPIANFNGELLVPVKVTDGTDTTAAVIATITVDATNDAPTLTSVTAQEITEDGNLEILLSMTNATDIDGDDLSLIIREGDSYTVDGTIVTPIANFNGELLVPVKVTDGTDTTAAVIATITVDAINDAPVIDVVSGNLTTYEDSTITLDASMITAFDPENDELSFIVDTGINYTVLGTTVTPAANYSGTLLVPVHVNDNEYSSNPVIITVNVISMNDAPVISSIADTSATEDLLYYYNIVANDADKDVLSYTLENAPEGMEITNNLITWIPTEGVTTSGEVTLKVSDSDTFAVELFTVTVTQVNDAPVITSSASAIEDQQFTYVVSATDADGDLLTYSLENAPAGMVIANNIITWTPLEGVTTSGEVSLIVSDGRASAQEKFTVSVTQVNDAPTITTIVDQTIFNGQFLDVTLDMTDAEDVDGDDLFLIVTSTDTNCTISGTTVTPKSSFIGTTILKVAVTDGIDTTESVNMNLTVDVPTKVKEMTPFTKEGYSLKVAPTPTKDSGKVMAISEENGKATFTIFTTTERKQAVISKEITANEELKFNWDVISKLQPDVYFIEMKINGDVKAIETIVKIKK